jgi:hypothetical protein
MPLPYAAHAERRDRQAPLAWADRPEARTEAALYGTPAEIGGKLDMLRDVGVIYGLANILGQSREALRRLATDVAPMLAG